MRTKHTFRLPPELAKQLADAAEHSRPAALLTIVDPGARGNRIGARTVVDPAQRDASALARVGLEAFALERLDDIHDDGPLPMGPHGRTRLFGVLL